MRIEFKVIIASIIAMFIIMVFPSTIFASTGTVELKANVYEVKKGETFTITVSAKSEEGINGIDTKYTYDSEEMELVSENVYNSNWTSLGTSPNITVVCNSMQSIKEADIYVLTFKVKDSVNIGSTLKMETENILLDTDASTNSEITINPKKVEITVIGNSEDNTQDDTQKDDTQKDDAQKDNTQKGDAQKDDTQKTKNIQGDTNNRTSETTIDTNTTQNTIKTVNKTDSNISKGVLPNTGERFIIILVFILITIILSIIFCKKYIDYRDIK